MALRRVVAAAVSTAMLGALFAGQGARADAEPPGPEARWSAREPFAGGSEIIYTTLHAEVSASGRGMTTFTRHEIDDHCGYSDTRIRRANGTWTTREPVRVTNSDQMQLVAGDRLAWIGAQCTGRVELRFAAPRHWRNASISPNLSAYDLRAGMGTTGRVALADWSGSTILVYSARAGEEWQPLRELDVAPSVPVVDHVAVTADDTILVLWHAASEAVVSAFDGRKWSSTPVPGHIAVTRIRAATDDAGNMIMTRTLGGVTRAQFRAADGTISEPEQVATNVSSAGVQILPGGDALVAWTDDDTGTWLGRRTAEGTWTRENVDPTAWSLSMPIDAHDDGTITIADTSRPTAWLCSWTTRCKDIGYPPSTDHGAIAAGPERTALAVSGLSLCDDWCEFEQFGGYVYE